MLKVSDDTLLIGVAGYNIGGLRSFTSGGFYVHGSVHRIALHISNQLNVTFSKFFHFIFATLHVSGVPCPSSGVGLLHW
jgi:hypothetical protein